MQYEPEIVKIGPIRKGDHYQCMMGTIYRVVQIRKPLSKDQKLY